MKINNLTLPVKRVSYRWLDLSESEINKIKSKFKVLSPKAKEYFELTPFLSVVLTQECILKCAYCCEGGEGTYSQKSSHNIKILKERIRSALETGVKKIRLTGGEPFLYLKSEELLKTLKELKKSYNFFLLINTNATLPALKNFIPLLKELDAKLVVHIDTINKEKYIKITKSNERFFSNVTKNIKLLKENNLLHRFNAVISKYNIEEFDSLVNFAHEVGTNIKTFDITEVPNQYINKKEIYTPLDNFIKNLRKKAKEEFFHPYAIAFGTPVQIYDVDSVLISVKYTKYGSRYSDEHCKNCPFFPCDEGLYDILYYPDDTLWACRWYRPRNILKNNFEKDLSTLFRLYKKTRWFIGNKFVE